MQCSAALVYDYLLSINNEYFVKLTYIPLEDLGQNVYKEKNQARRLKFCVHLRITTKNTHTNRRLYRTRFKRVTVSGVSLSALKQSQRLHV